MVLNIYKTEFTQYNNNVQIQRLLKQWLKEIRIGKEQKKIGKSPVYGHEVDKELYDNIVKRREKGLPVDNFIICRLLLPLLRNHRKDHLLKMNGGKYNFGESWARKFCKRWNLVQRKVTTKMRERPEDLEEKKEEFIRVAAEIFRRYDIPQDLVINCDETGVLFVPRAKFTLANKGTKRVRAIGVGSDKAQFTATIAVTESGTVLHTQLIFGGTTDRCHPGGTYGQQYEELLFDHSSTHWQTPQTYLRYLQEIIIPYKNSCIINNNLP